MQTNRPRPGSVVPTFIEKEKSGKRVAVSRKRCKIDDVNGDTGEDRAEKHQNDEEEQTLCDGKKSRVVKSFRGATGSCKNQKTDDENGDVWPKTTLIFCPPMVLSTWISQIKEPVRPGFLKVYLYHGKCTIDVEGLRYSVDYI